MKTILEVSRAVIKLDPETELSKAINYIRDLNLGNFITLRDFINQAKEGEIIIYIPTS